MAICAAHFSLLPTIGFSPPTPPFLHARNGSQIIWSTLSAVRQLLSPLVTSSAPFHRSPFVFEWTFLCHRHSPRSKSHRCTASVIRRLTSLLPPLCNTRPISQENHLFAAGPQWRYRRIEVPLCWLSVAAERGNGKMEAESGDRVA